MKMRLVLRLIAGALVLAMAAISGVTASPAAAQLPTSYKIRTVHRGPGEVIHRATIGVPTPIDLDGNVVPDVVVQLLPATTAGVAAPAGFALEISNLRPPTDPLRAVVEAIVPIPDTQGSVGLGYDSRSSTAPALMHQVALAQGDDISYEFSLVGGRPGFSILGSIFEGGPRSAQRVDSTAASLLLVTGPPTSGSVSSSESGAVQTIQASSTPPVKATLRASKTDGADVKTVRATIDSIPALTTVEIERDDTDEVSRVGYTAARVVASVDLTVEHRVDGALQNQAIAHLDQVPPNATLTRSGSRIEFNAPVVTPGWVAEAGLAKGRSVEFDTREAYVKASDDDATRSLAFKAAGVERAVLDTRTPLRFELRHEPRPLHASIRKSTLSLEGDIPAPPRTVVFEFDKTAKAGFVDADGQALGNILLVAEDTNGLVGRGKYLRLDAKGVPAFLRFSFVSDGATGQGKVEEEITETPEGEGGGGSGPPPVEDTPPVRGPITKAFRVDAFTSAVADTPAEIGSIVLKLASEENPRSDFDQPLLESGESDGFLLEDTFDQFLAFGRMRSLKSVSVMTVRDSRRKRAIVDVDSNTTFPVRVGFFRQLGTILPVEEVRAAFPTLPADLHLDFTTLVQDRLNSRTDLHYGAAERGSSLTFTTNAGNREHMSATLTPLPQRMDLCADGYGSCLRPVLDRIAVVDENSATLGTAVVFDASEPIALDLFDCIEDEDDNIATPCTEPAQAEKSVTVDLSTVQHAEFGEDVDLETDEEWVWIDSNGLPEAGSVALKKRGPNLRIDIPAGFKAQDRLIGFSISTLRQAHRAGAITCPAAFDVDFLAFVVGDIAKTITCKDNPRAKSV